MPSSTGRRVVAVVAGLGTAFKLLGELITCGLFLLFLFLVLRPVFVLFPLFRVLFLALFLFLISGVIADEIVVLHGWVIHLDAIIRRHAQRLAHLGQNLVNQCV